MTAAQRLSRIEPHEEGQAKAIIAANMQNLTGSTEMPSPCGYLICLKIYVRPDELKEITREDGTKATLYIPQVSQDQDRFQGCAALVLAVGPDAYKGVTPDGAPRYAEPWCKPGDWVLIPRYEGMQFTWKNKVAMVMLPDDKILAVIDDPTHVTSTHLLAKV